MTFRQHTSPFENRWTRTTILVLLAAVLFQGVLVSVVLPRLGGSLSSRYGEGFKEHSDLYDVIADNLVQGRGYRAEADTSETMMREPGYPLFLAAVFKLAGYRIEAVRIANILLAGGAAFMLLRLAQMVTGDEIVALLAALSFLFYPSIVVSEIRGGVEIAFTFVIVGFMLALHSALEKGDRWRYLLAGLILGAAVLIRSTALLFPACLLAYLLLVAKSWAVRWRAVANIAVLGVGVVMVMSPWVIRNYRLVHQLVPTATVQGVAAQEGLYTCQNLSRENDFETAQRQAGQRRAEAATRLGIPFTGVYYQLFYSPQDEITFNKGLMREAGKEYREHPALLAECAGENLLKFWFLGKTWQVTGLNIIVQLPLLALACMGVYRLRKRGELRNVGILLLFVLYVVCLHAPVIAHARHSVVLIPFMVILSSIALVSISNSISAHPSPVEEVEAPLLTTQS
jgi:4-amino-4-deoxy-L-arabinose transferase-like glycosyltransferase